MSKLPVNPLPSTGAPTKRSRSVLTRRQASPTTRANTTSVPFDTSEIRNDRLGTLVRDLVKQYQQAPSWEQFVKQFRGPSHLSEALTSTSRPEGSKDRRGYFANVKEGTNGPRTTVDHKI